MQFLRIRTNQILYFLAFLKIIIFQIIITNNYRSKRTIIIHPYNNIIVMEQARQYT